MDSKRDGEYQVITLLQMFFVNDFVKKAMTLGTHFDTKDSGTEVSRQVVRNVLKKSVSKSALTSRRGSYVRDSVHFGFKIFEQAQEMGTDSDTFTLSNVKSRLAKAKNVAPECNNRFNVTVLRSIDNRSAKLGKTPLFYSPYAITARESIC